MNSWKQLHLYDEESLVSMASKGDLDAFNQLVSKYQNLAYAHAYALLGDPAFAGDVTQESFIQAFQNIAGFRGGSFRAWILKIVTNLADDMLRYLAQHPTQSLFPNGENGDEAESSICLADPTASAENIVAETELSTDLYRLLDELPAVYRTVLTLVDMYELDHAEAAQVLRIPIGTVKSRLARARLQLREKLLNVETRHCSEQT